MTYTEQNRGTPQYESRMKQTIRFDGLKIGNITPTDIDGFFEIHGETFVFFEVKLEGATLPKGQSLALTRLVDYLQMAGRDAVLFICTHNVTDSSRPIMAHDLTVRQVYYKGRTIGWDGRTLKESVEAFVRASQKRRSF